jgi:hypothetical protein
MAFQSLDIIVADLIVSCPDTTPPMSTLRSIADYRVAPPPSFAMHPDHSVKPISQLRNVLSR